MPVACDILRGCEPRVSFPTGTNEEPAEDVQAVRLKEEEKHVKRTKLLLTKPGVAVQQHLSALAFLFVLVVRLRVCENVAVLPITAFSCTSFHLFVSPSLANFFYLLLCPSIYNASFFFCDTISFLVRVLGSIYSRHY